LTFDNERSTVGSQHVVNEIQLLLCKGQINPALYNEMFHNENDEPISSLKIILPKCTPLCQPVTRVFTESKKMT
jgi:hypothetical protein